MYTKEQIEDIFNNYDFSNFLFTKERLRKLGKQRTEEFNKFIEKYPGLVECYSEVQYLYEDRSRIGNKFCPVCGKYNSFNTHNRTYRKYCSSKCSGNSEETTKKREETCLSKYGCKHIQQSEEIKKKRVSTSRDRYGDDYNHRSKAKETERKHYNGKTYFETEEYKNFMKEHKDEINKKISDTVYAKTNKRWITQTTEFKEKRINTLNENGKVFISKGEQEIIDFIKELGFTPIKYIVGTHDTRFEIDCYIPELKIGVEYNGIYYHSKNGRNHKPNDYHYKKQLEAKALGIDLIQIWEDQWNNKKDLVKSILKTRLNKNSNVMYARKCIIKELDNDTYNTFCNNNHIQGTRQAKIRLGLYYNDELVQVSSFNKPRNKGRSSTQNTLYDYEFVRGCSIPNTNIIGGVSKLLSYFIKKYNPSTILSYVDWNLFNGNSYIKSGFKFIGYTGPDLFFCTSNLQRINRNPYKNKEHKELVQKNLLYECHGVGNLKMLWAK